MGNLIPPILAFGFWRFGFPTLRRSQQRPGPPQFIILHSSFIIRTPASHNRQPRLSPAHLLTCSTLSAQPLYYRPMRVIAGQYRHRKLLAPTGLGTRPILDRIKTALFDWLGSRLALPGSLPPMRVLDLFCGGGSLGIEALSRGAVYCAFVEHESEAMRCLLQNLDALHIGPAARFYHGSAENIRIAPPPGGDFDLVFFDPPYVMSKDVGADATAQRVLARLGSDVPVTNDALLVWRHDAAVTLPDEVSGWTALEHRTWGDMTISLYQRK